MLAVWKFPLFPGLNRIEMPLGSKPIRALLVPGEPTPVLCALVDPDVRRSIVHILVAATGQDISRYGDLAATSRPVYARDGSREELRYIDTFPMRDSAGETRLFHVFWIWSSSDEV